MLSQRAAEKIHDHLSNASTRKRLNERFATAREQLTTSIGEAARIAGISPEKARYVDVSGVLAPGRSNQGEGDDAPHKKPYGHRRYSLRQLNRLIIIGDLIDHGFNMSDIARYLNGDQQVVDTLIESIQASDLTTRLREAEATYVQRMLIPRFLYFTQCLLLGDVVDCSVGLVLPVGADAEERAGRELLTRVDDLPRVGPSLFGWHSRSHPYCVLYFHDPRLDDPTRYEMRSVDEMCREAGVAQACGQPTGAYLLIEREFAHLLHAASPNRTPETPRGETPNPRAVAYRLLQFLRQPEDEASHSFGHSFSSMGDGMIYSSPEFMNEMNGDRLLTEITELVVRLGNAVTTTKSDKSDKSDKSGTSRSGAASGRATGSWSVATPRAPSGRGASRARRASCHRCRAPAAARRYRRRVPRPASRRGRP